MAGDWPKSPVLNSFSSLILTGIFLYGDILYHWDYKTDHSSSQEDALITAPKAYFRCRAVMRRARTSSYSTAQIHLSNHFLGVLGRAVLNAFRKCATRLSTASKIKRCSVDVIFLCRLEKFEKYFLVNWGIIIEYFHKQYIK